MEPKRYGVIIADPPWKYGGGGKTFRAADHHYPTLSLKQLQALDVEAVALPDCVLLMWATPPQLETALRLGKSWGSRYVTEFPWVKLQGQPMTDFGGMLHLTPVWGLGFWVRGCSENVLLFKRGKPKLPRTNFMGLISAQFEHSRKPDNLYEYAQALEGPYLELFARRKRENWDAFGNEIEGSIILGVKEDVDATTL
jgi:N6-adenosine-specific RNA methylase IME4